MEFERIKKIIKLTFLMALVFFGSDLYAALATPVPEVPNFITLLYKKYGNIPWISFLHQWESLFFSILVASLISLVFYFGSRKNTLVPSKFQNFLEWVVESLQNFTFWT